MKYINIDLETFSSVNLAKSGVYRHAEAKDFKILLFGYSIDDDAPRVIDLANGEQLPYEVLSAITDSAVLKWAFNAQFERVCLSRYLNLPAGRYLDSSSWRCTLVWAATLGLPLSLEGVGAVLGLEKQKLKEGKDLIRYFCTPAKQKDGTLCRHLPADDPQRWDAFKSYNLRDVETEMGIQKRLSKFPVPDAEWENYLLDQQINDRGIMLDRRLVKQAIACDVSFKENNMALARRITGLENPNSPMQLKEWLCRNDITTDSLSKNAVAELLEKAQNNKAKEALMLRRELAKSSVKKYTAMETVVGSDSRARGLIQFYGANRTGRYAGRLIQVQNLPQSNLPNLEQARTLVRNGQFEAAEMLYDSVPTVLSELIRTAFIPKPGCRFYVADFSAIEARVIAWLAGEHWRQQVFADGGDIYCASASQMFHVPVEKHGVNGHLRQKGKQAELACIAEGQLVLTNQGLIPIEQVSTEHLLWDGETWVQHDGVIFKGIREVITYEGLTATPEHLVWIKGQPKPVQLGFAAACGAYLVQTGDGRRNIWLGKNNQFGKTMEQNNESLLCSHAVSGMRTHSVAEQECADKRKIQRMPALFSTKANSVLVKPPSYCCKTTMRKHKCTGISQLWRQRHPIRLSERNCCGTVFDRAVWPPIQSYGNRPHRQQWELCRRQYSVCNPQREQPEQTQYRSDRVFSEILAIREECGDSKTISRYEQGRNHSRCRKSGCSPTEKLEAHIRTARVYDIQNAGQHHRFTVSGKLVHNCGYGGSVGALKAMGALQMGLAEEELKPLVDVWRQANPQIVQLWWAVDRAVKDCVKQKTTTQTHGIRFMYQSGILFITLPSGRRLAYVKPRMGENKFGGEAVTYEGVGTAKKWERIESYGPKFVENIVQAIARDILAKAMLRLDKAGYKIVMHIHDEVVIEAPTASSLEDICFIMGQTPKCAGGLLLRADGYVCDFYRKD